MLSLPSPRRTSSSREPIPRGYSQLDWAVVQSTLPPLDPPRAISLQELRYHRTPQDCWCVLATRVYDITPYLPYHPGGIKQLMRGAGQDATTLFMQYHPWVNIHTVLQACYLGWITPS